MLKDIFHCWESTKKRKRIFETNRKDCIERQEISVPLPLKNKPHKPTNNKVIRGRRTSFPKKIIEILRSFLSVERAEGVS